MAQKELIIITRVIDQATGKLISQQKEVHKLGQAVESTSNKFTQFNRTMFATTAFIGMFQKAFSTLTDTLMKSAEIDRISGRFESLVGPKGTFFAAIRGFTSNSIDRIEAMRSAISLKTLGIAEDTGNIAELIARAGTAAKMAGFTSEEGIRRVTQSLKDGSLSSLEFLNQIKSNDPALKALFAILEHGTGVMGSAISAQMRYNLILGALRGVTKEALFDTRDLYDRLLDVGQVFNFLRTSIGTLLGQALAPIFEKIIVGTDKISGMIDRFKNLDSGLISVTKNIILLGGALVGTFAALGTFRLIMLTLGFARNRRNSRSYCGTFGFSRIIYRCRRWIR